MYISWTWILGKYAYVSWLWTPVLCPVLLLGARCWTISSWVVGLNLDISMGYLASYIGHFLMIAQSQLQQFKMFSWWTFLMFGWIFHVCYVWMDISFFLCLDGYFTFLMFGWIFHVYYVWMDISRFLCLDGYFTFLMFGWIFHIYYVLDGYFTFLMFGYFIFLMFGWIFHISYVWMDISQFLMFGWIFHISYVWMDISFFLMFGMDISRFLCLDGYFTFLMFGWIFHVSYVWMDISRFLCLDGYFTFLMFGWIFHVSYVWMDISVLKQQTDRRFLSIAKKSHIHQVCHMSFHLLVTNSSPCFTRPTLRETIPWLIRPLGYIPNDRVPL